MKQAWVKRLGRFTRTPLAGGYVWIVLVLLVSGSTVFYVFFERALRGEREIPAILRPIPTSSPVSRVSQPSKSIDPSPVSIELDVPTVMAKPPPTPTFVPGRPNAPDKYFLYTVEPGDALNSIASRFGRSFEELASLNGIDEPYIIKIGEQLLVPSQ